MNEIRVAKATLIRKMTENLEDHLKVVEEAQVGFREAVIKRLDEMLAAAKAGKTVDMYLSLQVPEDHSAEYETVLGMLELDINDFVDLNFQQYRNWVEDDWGWSSQFFTSNSMYSATAASRL